MKRREFLKRFGLAAGAILTGAGLLARKQVAEYCIPPNTEIWLRNDPSGKAGEWYVFDSRVSRYVLIDEVNWPLPTANYGVRFNP